MIMLDFDLIIGRCLDIIQFKITRSDQGLTAQIYHTSHISSKTEIHRNWYLIISLFLGHWSRDMSDLDSTSFLVQRRNWASLPSVKFAYHDKLEMGHKLPISFADKILSRKRTHCGIVDWYSKEWYDRVKNSW